MVSVGVDYGARRIGVAVSESGVIATAHAVVQNEGTAVAVERIAAIGESIGAEIYVVGIARGQRADDVRERRFRDFAELLRQRTCKPVVLWDEALTSVEAEGNLRASGRSRRDTKDRIDMEAARLILQSWIDETARRES